MNSITDTILKAVCYFIDNAETLGPTMGLAFVMVVITCAVVTR